MTTHAKKRFGLAAAAALTATGLAVLLSAGCELAVTFDRSLIDGGGGGSLDATAEAAADAGSDTSTPPPDTGVDAPAVVESGTDSAAEAGCAKPADCPAANDCIEPTCTAGVCGTSNVPSGTVCSSNGGKHCDGNGNCVACVSPTDCPGQTTVCVVDTCNSNTCGTASAAAGTACTDSSGKVCDGSGKCVACAQASDCAPQQTACLVNACTSNACTTTDAASRTACTDNGGKLCDGSGKCVACLAPTDCAAQTTACKTNTCDATAHTCGTSDAPKGTTCTDNGGVVCDGSGTCVATHCTDGVKDADETDVDCGGATCGPCADGKMCLLPRDCIDKVCDPTGKTCSAPTCSDGVQNGLETDVDCGGATCDAQGKACADLKHCGTNPDCKNNFCFGSAPGTCVSCMDGVKDGNETDTDCGGPQCDAQNKTCGTNQSCLTAGDCTSGFCQGNTTCELRPDGQSCTAGTQCLHGNCVGPAGSQVCCSTACNGNCQACTSSLNGGTTGTCGNITAGTTAPTGQCAVTTTCGNDGKCGAGGACEQTASGTTCGSPLCANGQLTPVGSCNGTGTCTGGTPAACPNGLKCASGGTACLTSCTLDTDCQDPATTYCANPGPSGTCVAKNPAGVACTAADQCTSGACGVNNTGTRCCTAACSPKGAPCGATDCDVTGACMFPSASTSCGSASCANGQLTPAGMCNGSGACNAGSPSACPGGVKCASGGLACLTSCASDTDCQDPTTTYCVNPGPSGTCVAKAGPGATCNAIDQCTSGICGIAGTGSRCCTATCSPTAAPCGATDCDPSGGCSFPSNTTSCGSASCANGQLTPAGMCSGSGTCNAGSPSACPGAVKCAAGGLACLASCGSDTDCQDPTTTYCVNPGASGTCTAKLAAGGVCSAPDQCTSGICGVSGTGTRCCTATCSPIGGICGASDCNASGGCAFTASGTTCTACAAGQLTTGASCDGAGACAGGTTAACTGGFICADAATCKTACTLDTDCQSTTTYCANPGASGTCAAKGGTGTPCTANDQCINGTCNGAPSGTCN